LIFQILELAVINKIKEPPNTGFDQCGMACDLKQRQKVSVDEHGWEFETLILDGW
jgi:hypothetical protein